MKISQVKKLLEEFLSRNSLAVELEMSGKYTPKKQWEDEIPLAKSNGLYFYSTFDGEIIYIGQSNRGDGKGIGFRSTYHLGRCNRKVGNAFPDHQWVNDSKVDKNAKDKINKAEFDIYSIKVTPPEASHLLELFLLTSCHLNEGKLPGLNKEL